MSDIIMGKWHYATSSELAAIITHGIEKGYNRSLERVPDLEPGWKHLIRIILVHEHINGKKVAPHYRCEVMIRFQGERESVSAILDVSFEDFSWLREIPQDVIESASKRHKAL